MLQIRLLGGLDVSADSGHRISLRGQPSRTLLAFLALHSGRLFRRDVLAGSLWGDRTEAAAQKALRNSLWRLRCSLEARAGADLLAIEGCDIGLGGDVWIDAREFEASVAGLSSVERGVLTLDQARELERAVALYRGDLLAGLYDPWTDGPRERFRLLQQTALEHLFAFEQAHGNVQAAIARGRALIAHNPLLEHVHRELMLCHCSAGDRPLAVRQYHRCAEVLRRELALEPMPETRALLERIRGDDAGPRRWSSTAPRAPAQAVPGVPAAPSGDATRPSAPGRALTHDQIRS